MMKERILPKPRRSSQHPDTSIERTEQSPSLHNSSQGSVQLNQGSYISYNNGGGNDNNNINLGRLQYQASDSPKRAGGKGYAKQEQTRYNDIMRSINNTEQFIKAK